MNKFIKHGSLQDQKIIDTLHQSAKDYENGEILEVKDVLIDIINAITEFEAAEEKIAKRISRI